MISIHKQVENVLQHMDKLSVIDTDLLKKESFPNVSDHAYVKALSRLNQSGYIYRIAKGMYTKPRPGKFGLRLPGEAELLKHFIGTEQITGVVTGYRLYNKYGLTTQISKTIRAYTTNMLQETKSIGNIVINKINLELNAAKVRIIELLEVIENYHHIEDINHEALRKYVKNAAADYSDNILSEIQTELKYKKRTLASLKRILDYYGKENSLETYLNKTSKYETISEEVLYEAASG